MEPAARSSPLRHGAARACACVGRTGGAKRTLGPLNALPGRARGDGATRRSLRVQLECYRSPRHRFARRNGRARYGEARVTRVAASGGLVGHGRIASAASRTATVLGPVARDRRRHRPHAAQHHLPARLRLPCSLEATSSLRMRWPSRRRVMACRPRFREICRGRPSFPPRAGDSFSKGLEHTLKPDRGLQDVCPFGLGRPRATWLTRSVRTGGERVATTDDGLSDSSNSPHHRRLPVYTTPTCWLRLAGALRT